MRMKLNQLIAMALIAAMPAAGLTAMAEETETETVAEVTESTETADAAESDELYQEAIGFLNYLGIFTGDENGDMRPEDAVSRAEIAAIILREMNITNMSKYNDSFSDVSSAHWAADIIQTAYENGIINGADRRKACRALRKASCRCYVAHRERVQRRMPLRTVPRKVP